MSYKTMMEFKNDAPATNALRFGTEEEALAHGRELFSRWTVPIGYHAEVSDDPVTHRFDFDLGRGERIEEGI